MPGDSSANDHAAKKYFEAIFATAENPDGKWASGVGTALTYASPNSPAALHAIVIQNQWAGWQANNSTDLETTLSGLRNIHQESGSVKACSRHDDKNCITYANFRFDENHRLEDFTEESVPIGSLTLAPRDTADVTTPLTMTFKGATDSVGGTLLQFVFDSYSPSSTVDIDMESAFYRGPNGKEEKVEISGPTSQVISQHALIFGRVPGAHSGGWFHFLARPAGGEWESQWIEIR